MSAHLYSPEELTPGFDSEPTFAQYALILRKRWKILFGVLSISLVVAITIITFYKPTIRYKYTTVLELGTAISSPETPATLLAKITEQYIPQALSQYAKEHGITTQPYVITVRIPNDSTTLIFDSTDTIEASDDIIRIQKQVSDAVVHYGEVLLQQTKDSLERTKKKAEFTLATVQAQGQFLPNELKRLSDSDELTKRQIKETADLIANAQKNRNVILSGEANRTVNQPSLATTLILIDNEIQQYRTRLATLEERLTIESKSHREELEKQIIDNKTAISTQQLVIDETQYIIDHLSPIRIAIPSGRYFQESSKNFAPLTIIVLMIVIGLFIGTILALFTESIAKASKDAGQQ